jgi:hypothetical protein
MIEDRPQGKFSKTTIWSPYSRGKKQVHERTKPATTNQNNINIIIIIIIIIIITLASQDKILGNMIALICWKEICVLIKPSGWSYI